jgi:hypothetical protein
LSRGGDSRSKDPPKLLEKGKEWMAITRSHRDASRMILGRDEQGEVLPRFAGDVVLVLGLFEQEGGKRRYELSTDRLQEADRGRARGGYKEKEESGAL